MTRSAPEPTQPNVASAIRDYASLCYGELPDDVHVRSYAGLWLLLAVLAPAVRDRERSELEAALGLERARPLRTSRDACCRNLTPAWASRSPVGCATASIFWASSRFS